MLPRASRSTLLADLYVVPGCLAQLLMLGCMLRGWQHIRKDVALRKIRHRITARLKEKKNLLAVGDPFASEQHSHAPPQWLHVQNSLGQWIGHEKPADRSRCKRTLLPR